MGRAKSSKSLTATRVQIAEILGVNPRTIDKFADEGLPIARRGKGGRPSTYSVKACVRWYVERERAALVGDKDGFSPQKERALLDRQRREEGELRIQLKRGELVPIQEVAQDLASCALTVKARMRRIPDSIADRLGAVKTTQERKAMLLKEIDEALRELGAKADALNRHDESGAA